MKSSSVWKVSASTPAIRTTSRPDSFMPPANSAAKYGLLAASTSRCTENASGPTSSRTSQKLCPARSRLIWARRRRACRSELEMELEPEAPLPIPALAAIAAAAPAPPRRRPRAAHALRSAPRARARRGALPAEAALPGAGGAEGAVWALCGLSLCFVRAPCVPRALCAEHTAALIQVPLFTPLSVCLLGHLAP